jgi:hypothetical protein
MCVRPGVGAIWRVTAVWSDRDVYGEYPLLPVG